jgi:hypothetical protein
MEAVHHQGTVEDEVRASTLKWCEATISVSQYMQDNLDEKFRLKAVKIRQDFGSDLPELDKAARRFGPGSEPNRT